MVDGDVTIFFERDTYRSSILQKRVNCAEIIRALKVLQIGNMVINIIGNMKKEERHMSYMHLASYDYL